MANLADQIREALTMFARSGTKPALIGGLAVVAHQVIRATKDVDFLVEAEAAGTIHNALLELSYKCIYRSDNHFINEKDQSTLLFGDSRCQHCRIVICRTRCIHRK